jgi:hypothetical protein
MKKNYIFTVCLLAVFSTVINAQTTVPSGDVSGTWTKAGSPYNVTGNIKVSDNTTLIMDITALPLMGQFVLLVYPGMKYFLLYPIPQVLIIIYFRTAAGPV